MTATVRNYQTGATLAGRPSRELLPEYTDGKARALPSGMTNANLIADLEMCAARTADGSRTYGTTRTQRYIMALRRDMRAVGDHSVANTLLSMLRNGMDSMDVSTLLDLADAQAVRS